MQQCFKTRPIIKPMKAGSQFIGLAMVH